MLDDVLHQRALLSSQVRIAVQEAATAWGIDIKRCEITEVIPDSKVSAAMDRQAAAERERREKVLQAEGEKQSMSLRSEGQLIRTRNEAQAQKERLALEADGYASALRTLSAALKDEGGKEAAQLLIARQYIDMYGQIGQSSNTMIFNDRPADVQALLAQSAAVMSATGTKAMSPPPAPKAAPAPGSSSSPSQSPSPAAVSSQMAEEITHKLLFKGQ